MTVPHALPGLSAIADRYDVLLCDVLGRDPQRPGKLPRRLRRPLPVPRRTRAGDPDLQFPAPGPGGGGSAGRTRRAAGRLDQFRHLRRRHPRPAGERAPGPAWRIGPDRDNVLYEGLGLEFAGPSDAAFIACSGPVNDEVETPRTIAPA